nr:MAG TPA: hypothetical protein [Caudoviricetes sp.]DAV74921.1 MAG TPA: hypothetical protein [Caudoviricetes sp.]
MALICFRGRVLSLHFPNINKLIPPLPIKTASPTYRKS